MKGKLERTTETPRHQRACLACCLLLATAGAAHDLPTDVAVQAYVKPAGQNLIVLVRVPLQAMRDLRFPVHGPGYLDLERADPVIQDAARLWLGDFLELYENDTLLPKPRLVKARVSLPSDRSFLSFEDAAALLAGPRLAGTEIYWSQALLDAWFEYPIRAAQSEFAIRTGFARLGTRVVTALRFLPAGGTPRAFELTGDPGLVRLDPRWHQAALRFVQAGFFHILEGVDHLLFLGCLVIPLRRFRTLVLVVTSFTVAHSVTLIASALDLGPNALWFPPLIETLIAASIVYMALENIAGARSIERRWIITFAFGLVHGFGFSFALRETLQFAGSHLLTSLLSFNVGVEAGQLLVLLLLVPALDALFRHVVAERAGTIILSALVAHTGWHWMIERWQTLSQFAVPWPALLAGVLRWTLVAAALLGLLWLAAGALRKRAVEKTQGQGIAR
jgi:hypothetical protein